MFGLKIPDDIVSNKTLTPKFPCEFCGEESQVFVNHKNGDTSDNTLANVEVICPACFATATRHGRWALHVMWLGERLI